jgi:hypothetical protein
MSNKISKTWDEWVNEFRPLVNVMEPDGFDGQKYHMFRPEGEQLQFVQAFDQDRVWTFIDTPEGEGIYNGYTEEKAIGYYLTEETVDSGTTYEVDFKGIDQGEDPNE